MRKCVFALFVVLSLSIYAQVYVEPPAHFSPNIEAAGCFIECGERVLFLKRSPEIRHGDTWAVPGGKVESGENPTDAIWREVWEETGLHLEKSRLEFLRTVYIREDDLDFVYHMFRYRLEKYPVTICLQEEEATEYRWYTLAEALKLQLIPGEAECIHLIEPCLFVNEAPCRTT